MTDPTGTADLAQQAMGRAARAGLELSVKPWETGLFARQVFSLAWPPDAGDRDAAGWSEALREVEDILTPLAPVMISSRVGTLATDALEAMQNSGFRLMECYLTLSHDLADEVAAGGEIRVFREDDLARLTAIAGTSFALDRFHLDPELPRELADRSRVEWVANGCRGRSEAVYVSGPPGEASGFVLCTSSRTENGEGTGRLDLMGVDPAQRRRGLGRALTRAFLAHCRRSGYARGLVGTQAHNTASLRTYEAEGFRIAASHYSLHRHIH